MKYAIDTIILKTENLCKSYRIGSRNITVLEKIDLAVGQGEFIVIEGKSGSGKSTLLSLLSGLDKPDSGSIILAGKDITHLSEDALAPVRNKTIGYVFQSYHLVPSLSVIENVMFPAQLNHDSQARKKAAELLEKVGLIDRLDSFPNQLSGGEKQRAAICRALVNTPLILFADEPTGNLDSTNGAAILELLQQLRSESNATLVLATHSREISSMADRIIRLADGRITEQHRRTGS